jgi:hypothetical protein
MQGEKIKCNNPTELGVVGLVDHTHAALTKLFEDLIVGND